MAEDSLRMNDLFKTASAARWAVVAILSLIEALSITLRFPSLSEGEPGFAQMVYQSVGDSGLILVALAVLCFVVWVGVFKTASNLRIYQYAVWTVLSMLLSAILVVGRAFSSDEIGAEVYGSFDTLVASRSRVFIGIVMYAGLTAFLFSVLLIADRMLNRLSASIAFGSENACGDRVMTEGAADGNGSNSSISSRIRSRISSLTVPQMMAVLVVFWLPYIIAYFPGCLYHDSSEQLCQFFGAAPLSARHPLATTYLYGGLVSLGRALGSDMLGVFLCMAAQTVALAFACSRVVSCSRKVWGSASLPIVVVPLLVFALVPLWPSAATSIKKDAFFYAAFSLLVVHLVELVLIMRSGQRGKRAVAVKSVLIAGFALLCALIRNDGLLFSIFAIGCTLLFVFVSPGFRWRKSALAFCAAGVLVVFFLYFVGYHSIIMKGLNAQEGSSVEALTIPIQQTARFYILAEGDVTDEIEEGVSRVLDTKGLTKDVYNPLVSDNIKFGYAKSDFDTSDLIAFARAYFEMGVIHPALFAEAFIDQTLGWWYPEKLGKPDWTVGEMGLYQNAPKPELYSQVVDIEMPLYDSPAIQGFKQAIACFGYIPVVGLLVYPAIYYWFLLFMVAFLLANGRGREILMLAPFFLYFAICIASPVNGLTRYAVPIITCMPILIAWVLAYRPREGDILSEKG